MKKGLLSVLALMILTTLCQVTVCPAEEGFRRLSVEEYRDKMKAGWIGQIAGVCWGAPTEFRWVDKIIPEADVPKWTPEMINNAFMQDDLYVEMTFLRTLEQYGLGASIAKRGLTLRTASMRSGVRIMRGGTTCARESLRRTRDTHSSTSARTTLIIRSKRITRG